MNREGDLMTHSKLILMVGIIMVLAFSVDAEAKGKTKDVNVVNEPNVNVLNNVDVNITNDENNPVPVTVQNGAAEKELVEIVELDVEDDDNTETVFDVYTVGTDKRLVITDVIVLNLSGGGLANMRILRDGVVVSNFSDEFGGGGTYNHSYVSGIEFAEGEIVGISPGPNAAGKTTNWELRGYLTDVNGS